MRVSLNYGFPFWGVPIIRIVVFWGLYWGPLILGNYHIYFVQESLCMILRKAAFASTVRMDMSFFDKPENQTASILVSLERHRLYRGYIGVIGYICIYTGYIYIYIYRYWGYVGRMEKKMETTMGSIGTGVLGEAHESSRADAWHSAGELSRCLVHVHPQHLGCC